MHVIKGSFYNIAGIYEVMKYQFTRLLSNR